MLIAPAAGRDTSVTIAVRSLIGADRADHDAGGRHDAVVGAQHRGPQPVEPVVEPALVRFVGVAADRGLAASLAVMLASNPCPRALHNKGCLGSCALRLVERLPTGSPTGFPDRLVAACSSAAAPRSRRGTWWIPGRIAGWELRDVRRAPAGRATWWL